MESEVWLIGLSNTFHLFATILWIGWSFLLPIVVAPNAAEAHQQGDVWPGRLLQRVPPLAYGSLAALWATGMIQMSAHPQYEGMFSLSNLWSALLFTKHLLILGSILLMAYLAQSVSPGIRLALRRESLGKESGLSTLLARFRLLSWANLALGAGVLLLTGIMTAIR